MNCGLGPEADPVWTASRFDLALYCGRVELCPLASGSSARNAKVGLRGAQEQVGEAGTRWPQGETAAGHRQLAVHHGMDTMEALGCREETANELGWTFLFLSYTMHVFQKYVSG